MNYIFIALGVVLVLSIALMAFFSYLASHIRDFKSKRALNRITAESPYNRHKPKHSRRGDDFLAKDKIAEKKKQEELSLGVTKYKSRDQEVEQSHEQDEVRIVGFVEPKGFWSRFVMQQKIGFIVAMGGLSGNKKGYWQNLIRAQAASQGKNQTRGR